MCDTTYDESDVQVFEWIKARVERTCCACQEPIKVGQIYHRCKYLFDGRWSSYDHCGRCFRMCEAIWDMVSGEAIDLTLGCGEIWENPPDDVAALAFALPGELDEAKEYAGHRRFTAP